MGLFRSMGARWDSTRGTAAIEVRKGLANLFTGPGVLPGATSPLVTGTAGWAYSVGIAGFVSTRGASDGVHLYGNDGAVTIGTTGVGSTVPPAPGSGLQRIDIIWVKHPSASENSDTVSDPSFGVSSGNAASIAVAPSIPTGALELARNLMTSSATTTASTGNTITQTASVANLVSTVSDTGWITPTNAAYNSPWLNGSGSAKPFAYRIVGNRAQLRGALTGGASGTVAIRIPALIPAQTQVIELVGLTAAATTTSADPRAFLSMLGSADGGLGDMGIYFTSVSGLAYFGFDGISYLLG